MNYIVFDLEWNQPKNRRCRVHSPINLSGEIIQIGAVKLNENLEEIDDFDVKIKPVFYPKINKEVEKLTGITDDDLKKCPGFEDAIGRFREWCGEDNIALTWGPSDIKILTENLIMYDMDCEWIPEDFDAQSMFDFQETMEGRCFSLDYAFYYFGLKGIKAHDALNDARDTAAVIRCLDLKDFIHEEREYRKELEEEGIPLVEEAVSSFV